MVMNPMAQSTNPRKEMVGFLRKRTANLVLRGHDAWKKIFSQMVDLDGDESHGTK